MKLKVYLTGRFLLIFVYHCVDKETCWCASSVEDKSHSVCIHFLTASATLYGWWFNQITKLGCAYGISLVQLELVPLILQKNWIGRHLYFQKIAFVFIVLLVYALLFRDNFSIVCLPICYTFIFNITMEPQVAITIIGLWTLHWFFMPIILFHCLDRYLLAMTTDEKIMVSL